MLSASLLHQRRPSVSPSVCHTAVLCQNDATYYHEIFTVATARTLVFCDKFSCRWVRGFPSNDGVKQGYPPTVKSRHFTAIGSSSVITVAHRHRHAAYHNKHCWRAFQRYQHRWPWTTLNPNNRGFSAFFAILGCGAQLEGEFSLKLLEIDQDNLHTKFNWCCRESHED